MHLVCQGMASSVQELQLLGAWNSSSCGSLLQDDCSTRGGGTTCSSRRRGSLLCVCAITPSNHARQVNSGALLSSAQGIATKVALGDQLRCQFLFLLFFFCLFHAVFCLQMVSYRAGLVYSFVNCVICHCFRVDEIVSFSYRIHKIADNSYRRSNVVMYRS